MTDEKMGLYQFGQRRDYNHREGPYKRREVYGRSGIVKPTTTSFKFLTEIIGMFAFVISVVLLVMFAYKILSSQLVKWEHASWGGCAAAEQNWVLKLELGSQNSKN